MRKLTQLCTRGARGVCLIFVCAFAAAQLIMHGRCACVCECAQIMLIIVTQLAAKGREEGGEGRGASQLNPNGCIRRQRRPQTIPVQCRNSSCRCRRRQLCNFLISLTLCLPPNPLYPSPSLSLSFLFLWRCMKVISCMRN